MPAPLIAGRTLDKFQWHMSRAGGKPLIVAFWTTECDGCERELPKLQAFATEHPEVVVVGVHADPNTNIDRIKAWAHAYNLSFPVIPDDGRMVAAYGVEGVPTTFVIDGDGILLDGEDGYSEAGWNRLTNLVLRPRVASAVAPPPPAVITPAPDPAVTRQGAVPKAPAPAHSHPPPPAVIGPANVGLAPRPDPDTARNMADVAEAMRDPKIARRVAEDVAAEKGAAPKAPENVLQGEALKAHLAALAEKSLKAKALALEAAQLQLEVERKAAELAETRDRIDAFLAALKGKKETPAPAPNP